MKDVNDNINEETTNKKWEKWENWNDEEWTHQYTLIPFQSSIRGSMH